MYKYLNVIRCCHVIGQLDIGVKMQQIYLIIQPLSVSSEEPTQVVLLHVLKGCNRKVPVLKREQLYYTLTVKACVWVILTV